MLFFIRNTVYLIISPKKHLFLTKEQVQSELRCVVFFNCVASYQYCGHSYPINYISLCIPQPCVFHQQYTFLTSASILTKQMFSSRPGCWEERRGSSLVAWGTVSFERNRQTGLVTLLSWRQTDKLTYNKYRYTDSQTIWQTDIKLTETDRNC